MARRRGRRRRWGGKKSIIGRYIWVTPTAGQGIGVNFTQMAFQLLFDDEVLKYGRRNVGFKIMVDVVVIVWIVRIAINIVQMKLFN